MVRKKIYYKKPNYKKLIVDLIQKKYLSLMVGIFISFLVFSFVYNQFLSSKISKLSLKKVNLSFLKPNKKPNSSLSDKQKQKEKQKKEKKEKKYDFYTVLEGDSLSLIAQKFYGDLYKWPLILEYNNINNPDNIEVGMVLKIPKITQ